MNDTIELSLALGHLRNAAAGFIRQPDPTGEAMFLAAECLDVECLVTELGVLPEWLPDDGATPSECLARSVEVLESAPASAVPLGVWAAVKALHDKAL